MEEYSTNMESNRPRPMIMIRPISLGYNRLRPDHFSQALTIIESGPSIIIFSGPDPDTSATCEIAQT